MRRKRRHRRNFWREWDQEREKHGFGRGHRHRMRRKRAQQWREFFHNYMGTWPEDHWAFGGRRFNPWRQGMDTFNPLVASLLSKGGGLLPLLVLHLLSKQERYGNELMELINERTNGQWVANPGAIYPLMTVLEEQGLIAGEWEDPRKRTVRIYRLTPSGSEELERMKAVIRPKIDEAIEVLQSLTQDFNGDEYI